MPGGTPQPPPLRYPSRGDGGRGGGEARARGGADRTAAAAGKGHGVSVHEAGAEALAAAMQRGEEAPLGVWGEAAGALGVVGAALVQGFDMLAADSPEKSARAPFTNSLGGSAPLARPFHKGPPGTARAPFGNLTNAQGGRLGRDPMEKSRALGAKTFKEFQRRKQERMAKAREGGGGSPSPTGSPQPPATPPQDGGQEEGAEGNAWGVRMPLWGGMSLAVTVEQEEQMLQSRTAEGGAAQSETPPACQEQPPPAPSVQSRQQKTSALGVLAPTAERRDTEGTQSRALEAEDHGSWETIDLDRPFVSAPPPPVPAAAMTDFPTWGATGALPELPQQAPAEVSEPISGPRSEAAADAPPTDGWDCEWTAFKEMPQEQPPPHKQQLQLPTMGPLGAALVIQGCWRGHMARRFCQSLRDLAFREQQAAQAEMELREVAVSVLQKAWQRRAARIAAQKAVEVLWLQRQLETEAAAILQRAWRNYTAWRHDLVLTEFQARETAAVQIQRRARGQMGRKTVHLIRSERATQARAQARAKAEAEARALADAEAEARALAEAEAEARALAEAEARALAEAEARALAEAEARALAEAEARALAEAEARALVQAEAEARALVQAEAEARAWREECAAGAIQKQWKSHQALKKRRKAARAVEVEPMKVSEAQEMRAELNALKKQIELLTQAISLNHAEAPAKKGRRSRSRSQGKKEDGEGHHRSRSLSAAPRDEAAHGPDACSEGKKGAGRRGRRSRSLPRYAAPVEGGGQPQAQMRTQPQPKPREREELLAAPPGLANLVLEALPKRYGGGRKNRHGGRRQPRS